MGANENRKGVSDTKQNETEIAEVYCNWKKAVMTNDLKYLQNLYPDDFCSITSAGLSKNKSEVLTRLAFKDVKYLCWADKDIIIEFKEENAIVKSSQSLSVELFGLPMKIDREIELLFERDEDKWILRNILETNL